MILSTPTLVLLCAVMFGAGVIVGYVVGVETDSRGTP